MIRFFLIIIFMCGFVKANRVIIAGTEATYPPFEFKEKNILVGFDIDLVNEIGKELGAEVRWVDMQLLPSLLPALNAGKIDVIASALTITEERSKNNDFSIPYGYETMALVYRTSDKLLDAKSLEGKKICVQLAGTAEIWAKSNLKKSNLYSFDTPNQCVESVKSGQLDALISDGAQAVVFVDKNPKLSQRVLVKTEDGYGFSFKKGSKLKYEFDDAIRKLEADGRMEQIKQKWNVQF